MTESETATSNGLLSALKPRSVASEAVLLCWIAWFVFRCVVHLFRFVADRDIYSTVLRAYDDAPLMLLDSILAPAIVYGLFRAGESVRPSAAEQSVPARGLMRRGCIVRASIRVFPQLTAVLTREPARTRAAAVQAGEALDAKRLAAAWLLGGVVPLAFGYVYYRIAPRAPGEYGPFVAAFVDVCAVVFLLRTWPRVFGLSRLRLRVSDLAVGVLSGYCCANITVLVPATPIAWPWTMNSGLSPHLTLLFLCAVLIVPAAEELVFRGMILASLCQRMPVPLAVLIASAAAAVLHLPPARWLPALVAQLIFCAIYLARDRSIAASIAAHAVSNAVLWWPDLIVAGHFLK